MNHGEFFQSTDTDLPPAQEDLLLKELSSYALVGTMSPWVLGLTLCFAYLYLCPPLPDEFLEVWTWLAVLISIAVDFFLVLPPTPWGHRRPRRQSSLLA